MSVRVMSWVWSDSLSRGSDRLVLLAIADCASEDGSNAYPSMAELVRKTGLSIRAVQYALKALTGLGELYVAHNGGPKGCNRYRVLMREEGMQTVHPANGAPLQTVHPAESAPVQRMPEPDANVAPVTVLEPSENSPSESSSRRGSDRRPDVERICAHLADRIAANGSKRPTITSTWRTEARLLLDRDGRTADQVIRAIDWCQADSFWRSNVLSMPKLRAKYDQLRLAAARATERASPKPSAADLKVGAALDLATEFDRKAITA